MQRTNAQSTGESWPRDQAEWLFLPRAIDVFGAHLFGPEWVRLNALAPIKSQLPSFADSRGNLYQAARREAHQILSAERDSAYVACPYDVRPVPFGFQKQEPYTDYDFSKKAWERAEAIRASEVDQVEAERNRLGDVRSSLLDLFTMGTLQTGLMKKSGFMVAPMAPEIWSVVQAHNVFSFYQIDPQRPNTHFACGSTFHWVFVSRSDIERTAHAKTFAHSEGKSGFAGRPTSSHLVEEEARRLIASAQPFRSLRQFSIHLSAWLSETHPKMPRALSKTIQNNPEVRRLFFDHRSKEASETGIPKLK